jgi:hypothetical protein
MTPQFKLHEKLFARMSVVPWIQKIGNILVALNVLHVTTGIGPLGFFSIGLGMGLVLLISSLAVGMASFLVKIEIETGANENIQRTLDLGYLSQMNYGIWYLLFCPILLALVALAYDAMRKAQQSFPSMLPSFERLGKTRWLAATGIVVLGFFVFKNIIVEWDDYKNLSLGWVQAKPLQDYRDEIARTNVPIDLVARGKKFDRFLIPPERFIQRDEIRAIKIREVDPNLHVRSFWGMLLFIVLTKFWVGLWEAIVVYFAIIALTWGLMGARHIDLPGLKDATGAFYHLSWLRRPAFYIFLVGVLVNLFCIFRYTSNAAKGSYGKWDQYWSLLVFSPALFLLPVFHIFATIYNSSENEEQAYLSKRGVMAASVWIVSFGYVIYLVLGYINPRQQTILVACFKPFISGFKKMIGL